VLDYFTVTNLTFCPTLIRLKRFVNTCYLNTGLQTLFSDDKFVGKLMRVPSRGLVGELQRLIEENIVHGYVSDEALWRAFCCIGSRLPLFSNHEQQCCCAEFLELLVHAVTEDAPELALKEDFEVLLALYADCSLYSRIF
jgi:ubiquitin C-terminal hydrolase